jgi:phosphosulfolactate synthase
MSTNRGFPGVPIHERATKPRDTGLTMMIDWGLPLTFQSDLVELSGSFMDLAKVAVGLSGILPLDKLRAKIQHYQANGIEPFPGGMYLEYAFAHQAEDEYWEGCTAAGYRLIEVSDNAIPLGAPTKARLIRAASERGFRVLGEVGSKHVATGVEALIEDVRGCLEAGAWKVLVEAAEMFAEGQFRSELIEDLARVVDPSQLMWELPGSWIPDVHEHQVHSLAVWLIEHLGTDTNIANVMPMWVAELETLRMDVGVSMLAGNRAETN